MRCNGTTNALPQGLPVFLLAGLLLLMAAAPSAWGQSSAQSRQQPLPVENAKQAASAQQPRQSQTLRVPGAMQGAITGTVTSDATGEPIPGVNVLVEGTDYGAATGAEGTYEITGVEPGTYTVRASFVGYGDETEEGVEVSEGETTTVDIAMQQQAQGLDEVVIVGYGEQQREDLTGAVSTISGEDVAELPVTGVEEAMKGKAPGVYVRSNSGAPGAPVNVQIRGVTTIGNTSPLYVIDGVPVFNNATGSQQSNPLSLINPNSIASINVLKDASATAIYGARAANGVVVIETKRGEAGNTRVSVDLSGGVQRFNNYIPLLDSQQYAEFANEAFRAAGRPAQEAFQNPAVLEQNTDWQEEAFETAPIQDYSATISGGGETAQFAIVGGYLNQEGVLPASGYKRYDLRVNTDINLTPNLRIGESAMLARSQWEGGKTGGDALVELLQSAPTLSVRDTSNLGGFAGPRPEVTGANTRANRIATMSLTQNQEIQNRVLGNVYAEYEFIPGLAYRLNLSGDFTFGSTKNFVPAYELGSRSNPTASLFRAEENERTYLVENTLNYDQLIGNTHNLSAVVGYTQQRSTSETLSGTKDDFPSNDLRTVAAGLGASTLQGFESEWAMRSLLARVNYEYDGRYLLTATLRRDGSSRFGENQRYGNFPSFSLGWQVGEEAFMQNVEAVSSLKLRGGWGRVGNQSGITNYAAIGTIDPVADYVFGSGQVAPGATYLSLGNPDLRWEMTEQTNVGVDAGLFEGALSLSANYYRKDTEDLLLRLPINTTSGIARTSGPVVNAAALRNSGFEFQAGYQSSVGDVQYNLSANFSTLENEVTDLGGAGPITNQVCADPACALTYTQVGGEIGAHYGYVADGLFDSEAEVEEHATQPGAAPGDIRFEDLNDDGVIDGEDRTVIGSATPDYFYGVSGRLSYRGADLSFALEGVQGRDIYNLQRPGIADLQGDNNNVAEVADRWTPQNTDTDVPRAISGDPNDNDRASTRFLEDGSFLRLSQLVLGYRFDLPALLGESASRLRVYVAAQNLFTSTDYSGWNPDIGSPTGNPTLAQGIDAGTYPVTRQYNVGIQATF